ncbi:MAG TPA: hypothetical protein VFM93_00715 [Candidatus Limnocylindria bacterium]|nr:hypothetical protein [Candidatus Limnocylindria bacterium]
MSIRRTAILATLVAVALIGASTPAAAENDGNAEQAEAIGIFKAALAEYRLALQNLRGLCSGPKASSDDCRQGMKELHSFVREIRDMARETAERIREERKAAEQAEREQKEKAAREEKERLDAERKADEQRRAAEKERRKAEEARRIAEKEKQKAAQQKDLQKVSLDLAKRKEFIKNRLGSLEELIEFHRAQWEAADAQLRALRERLATATGPDRDRLAREVADAQRATDAAADWFFKYEQERTALTAELETLMRTVSSDVAAKVSKLEAKIRELESTAAYKMGKHDEAEAQAAEHLRIAGEKSGYERDRYLAKAAEMQRQADEWERLARDYQHQADQYRAELDRLLGK